MISLLRIIIIYIKPYYIRHVICIKEKYLLSNCVQANNYWQKKSKKKTNDKKPIKKM